MDPHCHAQAVAQLAGISAMPTFQIWKNGEKRGALWGGVCMSLLKGEEGMRLVRGFAGF